MPIFSKTMYTNPGKGADYLDPTLYTCEILNNSTIILNKSGQPKLHSNSLFVKIEQKMYKIINYSIRIYLSFIFVTQFSKVFFVLLLLY